MSAPRNVTVDKDGKVQWDAPSGDRTPSVYLIQFAIGEGKGYNTVTPLITGGVTEGVAPIDLSPNVMNFVRVGAGYGTGGIPQWSKPVGIMLSMAEDTTGKAAIRGVRKLFRLVKRN